MHVGASYKVFPDSKTPYLFLKKPTNQQIQSMNYEHSKKRIFFSSVVELDQSVSESNGIKELNYKHNMSFQDWYEFLKSRNEDLV